MAFIYVNFKVIILFADFCIVLYSQKKYKDIRRK